MGATVFEGAKVYALALPNGTTGYVWTEQTYDRKDGPGRSHWCTMAIGDRQTMIARVFGLAHSMPGGMIQTVGKISVAGFIKKLIQLVDDPLWIDCDVPLKLINSKKGFYDAITDANRQKFSEILTRHGQDQLVNSIAKSVVDGGVNLTLNLRDHFALIQELANTNMNQGYYNSGPVSYCWQLIPTLDHYPTVSRPSINVKAGAALLVPEISIWCHHFSQLNSEIMLAKINGESFVGDPTDIQCALIDIAKDAELTQPGYYKVLLDAFKRAEKQAFPDDLEFDFDLSKLSADHHLRDPLKVAASHYAGSPTEQFKVTLKQLTEMPVPHESNVLYWTINSMRDGSGVCKLVFPAKEEARLQQVGLF